MRLLVQTRLASRTNAFHTTIERMQAVVRTRSNVERTRLDEKRVIHVPYMYSCMSDGYCSCCLLSGPHRCLLVMWSTGHVDSVQ